MRCLRVSISPVYGNAAVASSVLGLAQRPARLLQAVRQSLSRCQVLLQSQARRARSDRFHPHRAENRGVEQALQ